MSKITYENKEAINVDTSIPNKNKGTADDFNEIKKVVNENEDHQIGIIKNICATLPTTTGYVEGDNVYLMNDNDNLIYTLTNGAWVSAGAPNSNKYYLLINDYYDSDYDWKYTRGIYKVDNYGYISEKVADYTVFLGGNAKFEEMKTGTYLLVNTRGFSYPTRNSQRNSFNMPLMSTVSIYRHSETTLTVGDMFFIHTADNKTVLGTITNISSTAKAWSVSEYYNALRIRKSTDTDLTAVNMNKLFRDDAMSFTKTYLWILGDTITLNYTEYGTQTPKTFTLNTNDMVQGNSGDVISYDIPLIIYKTNGERYKVTNLTSAGTTYLITKLDEEVYSTSETLTNKKWVDGKPIYRRVFTGTSISQISTGITNVETMVKFEALVRDNNSSAYAWRNVPWLYNSNDTTWMGGVFFNSVDGTIRWQVGSALIDVSKYVVIMEYTKSN